MKTFKERVYAYQLTLPEFSVLSGIREDRMRKWKPDGGDKDKNVVDATFQLIVENGVDEARKRIIDIRANKALTVGEELESEKYAQGVNAPKEGGKRDNNKKDDIGHKSGMDSGVLLTPGLKDGMPPMDDKEFIKVMFWRLMNTHEDLVGKIKGDVELKNEAGASSKKRAVTPKKASELL